MQNAVKFPESLPKIGQIIRFTVESELEKGEVDTVETVVTGRTYWSGGNCGFNIYTPLEEYRELEWHGEPSQDSSHWGEAYSPGDPGKRQCYTVLALEILTA